MDDDKDDQDILDQHVSRVWSDRTPHRSPGNISPGNQLGHQFRRKPHDMQFVAGGSKLLNIYINSLNYIFIFEFELGVQSSMRAAKSMPDSNIRKFTKWGSINTDRYFEFINKCEIHNFINDFIN